MGDPLTAVRALAPELIVGLTGALVLIIDLIWIRLPGSDRSGAPRLAYLAATGLAVAGVAAAAQAGISATLFDGLLVVDPLTTFFRLLFIGVGIVVLVASVDSLPHFTPWFAEFYALILWCTMGNMLLASIGELFTLYLCLQLTSLPLIVLIGFAKNDPRSGEAALKYLLLVLVSTAVFLYGLTFVYGALGTSTISEMATRLAQPGALAPVIALGLVLLLTGFAFKITAAPFQFWVPDVYEGAPTAVTAFLSVGSKIAGFALALRVIVTGLRVPLDWTLIFTVMAVLSMTLGNLGALRQTSIKRMLAYSGIAQAGYLLVGLAAVSETGVASVLFYTVVYSLSNLLAFAAVIVFADETGGDSIADYAGLARRAPIAALGLSVGLLSLAGLPLFAGFMAKFYVFLFAAEAGLVWLVLIAVANSVVALYYYLRVVWQVWVPDTDERVLTVPARTSMVMSVCAVGVVMLGVFPEPLLNVANIAAGALFGM